MPGAVDGGDTGELACDHYHRWRGDLDLMQALGVESYRFSIAWPRVLPTGSGTLNPAGVRFYRKLVEGLRERGIEPIATLYHWDLPLALQPGGGWDNRDTAERFAEYAALMAEELGDVVTQWITQNEPWVVAFLGHAEGIKAPGVRDWATAVRVSHHLLLAHGLARDAIRAARPSGALVGAALNLAPVHPASGSDEDIAAALRFDGYMNRWFLDPLLRGEYPADMLALYEERLGAPGDALRDGDLQIIGAPADFLGINYYSPQRVGHEAGGKGPLDLEHVAPTPPTTAMGWEIDASGLRDLLGRVRRDYRPLPIYITENGAAFDDPAINGNGTVDDVERTSYLSITSRPCAVRSATASTSSATACGRCSTTSSGSTATRSASGSCTSTTRRSGACRSAAGSGTATTSRRRATEGRADGRHHPGGGHQGVPRRHEGRRRPGPAASPTASS